MSWREAPLKFSPRVTAARGIVWTNPTGPWSVDALVSGCQLTVCRDVKPLAAGPPPIHSIWSAHQQEKERKGVSRPGRWHASWLMFTGVHLSVIVNDWNKVAPVTDLTRVRLGQEILTSDHSFLAFGCITKQHYIYTQQWKRLGRLHSVGSIYGVEHI
jgi:hypothetical protein